MDAYLPSSINSDDVIPIANSDASFDFFNYKSSYPKVTVGNKEDMRSRNKRSNSYPNVTVGVKEDMRNGRIDSTYRPMESLVMTAWSVFGIAQSTWLAIMHIISRSDNPLEFHIK